MELSIKQQQWSYENAKTCYICKEKFKNKYLKDKKYPKVRHHWLYKGEYRGAAHSKCNLKHSVPKKILIALHNGSNYDHHFIIKELAVEKKITFLGEKYWKIDSLYSSNRKRSYKNW